ncbi:unnamed protein product, partial [Linum tenue]
PPLSVATTTDSSSLAAAPSHSGCHCTRPLPVAMNFDHRMPLPPSSSRHRNQLTSSEAERISSAERRQENN